MAKLLFKLTHVPDDEAEDIRALLEENNIRFYETNAGRWRVGLDAIWLPDDSRYGHARQLIDAYQEARTREQKRIYAELEASGEAPRLGQKIAAQPIRFMGLILALIFILAISIAPFWLGSLS